MGRRLGPLTTLGVGGPADAYVETSSSDDLREAIDEARRDFEGQLHLLGEGSNVVISDSGLRGMTVRQLSRAIQVESSDLESVVVAVDAGLTWDEFVDWSVSEGLFGIELLSGIPGQVGASPIQNVAAYGQAVDQVVVSVDSMNRRTGEQVTIPAALCGFRYRGSRFKDLGPDGGIIHRVRFRLNRESRSSISYRDLVDHFAQSANDPRETLSRRNAVLHLRSVKSMLLDPDDPFSRSAGSFFVSPRLGIERAREIVGVVVGESDIDSFFAWYGADTPDIVKVPASHLLLAAGFHNGDRWGDVMLSPPHILALVNLGAASAADIFAVSRLIRRQVLERTGVELEVEPRFLGAFEPDPELERQLAKSYQHPALETPDWVATHD